MIPSKLRPTTIAEAVERARSMVGYTPDPPPGAPEGTRPRLIEYRLTKLNGGKDPDAEHPADWSFGKRIATCDCSGFVAWSLGYSRRHDDFSSASHWINTDAMLRDAGGPRSFFGPTDRPELGAVLVYGGKFKDGKRQRAGHVGLVTGLPAEWDPGAPSWDKVLVTHCSASNQRRTGGAIRTTHAMAFGRGGAKFLRYLRAAMV